MILGSAWSADLHGRLTALGMQGPKLQDFSDSVGNGSASHVVGKPFDTIDTGLTPGTGVGTGDGISGFTAPDVADAIFAAAVGFFGQAGPKLQDICDAVGQTCEAQMALAMLSSSHGPVFSGSGEITPGSVMIVPAGWGSSIEGEGSGVGFEGIKWPQFAEALGKQAGPILASGTGTVTISGSIVGPPPPVPGAGSGSGTIAA